MNNIKSFAELGVCDALIEHLSERGISRPTPIQQLAIGRIAAGESIIVKSQTGSGKSLAYILPLVQRLAARKGSKALILLPTRELVRQVGSVCGEYGGVLGLSVAMIYGGVGYDEQRAILADDPGVIVATVGRLQDLMEQGVAQVAGGDIFILDEVDQMVDMGFREAILELAKLRSESAQTLCFSATVSDEAREVLQGVVGDVESVECEGQRVATERVEQVAYYVESAMRDQLLTHILRKYMAQRAIIFCRSRGMADRLCGYLVGIGLTAEAIHSERSQAAREYILERFRCGETPILVATDLMARGIDVEGVELIVNYGLPQNPEQYVHRIGRAGRGEDGSGRAVSLLAPDEKTLLDATCKYMRQAIAVSTDHPFATASLTKALDPNKKEPKVHKKRRR